MRRDLAFTFADPGGTSMRVLVANTLFPPHVVGGAELSVRWLVEALDAHGLTVDVLSLAPGGPVRMPVGQRSRVWFEPLNPLGNLLLNPDRTLAQKAGWHLAGEFDPRIGARMGRLLDTIRPDLVASNNLTGMSTRLWAEARRRGIPVVHTLRDYYLLCLRGTMYRDGRSCASQCAGCRAGTLNRRVATRHVDAVVGISRFILDHHLKAGCFARAPLQRVIPIPYEAPEGPPRPVAPAGEPLRLGFIGRLHRTKGLNRLVEALPHLPARGWTLSIAGRGDPEIVAWLAQATASYPVSLRGWVPADTFFREIDVLVAPATWQEPLGRTLAEALCHGVPVVASAVGGQTETVTDGVNGLLYPARNSAALAERLTRLIEDRALLSGLAARSTGVRERFAPDRVAGAYVALFHTLLATRQPARGRAA